MTATQRRGARATADLPLAGLPREYLMTDSAKPVQTPEELDRVLEELQQVEKFEPPAAFRAQANIQDPKIYQAAELDPQGYWAERARQLHWDRPFDTVLDDSDPPFFKWFADGTLNASYNCVDRHVRPGSATGSPTT